MWLPPRATFLSVFPVAIILTLLDGVSHALVRPCFKYEDGARLRCVKEVAGNNGDSFGRVGIINKSPCPSVRFTKQEWSMPCGGPSDNAVLARVFPGEVLKYGDFQQEMTQDAISPNTCGELRIMECTCGEEMVKCSDFLWAATYKRGEHRNVLRKFRSSQRAAERAAARANGTSANQGRCCRPRNEGQ